MAKKQMSLRTAYRWVRKKWDLLSEKNFPDEYDGFDWVEWKIPELAEFNSLCAYCELFLKGKRGRFVCAGCPLDVVPHSLGNSGCMSAGHLYREYDGSAKSAKKLLDLIIETSPYKRKV